MRITNKMLNELIANEGELKTGPINSMGILRMALDLKDARNEIGIWRNHSKVWSGMTDNEIREWLRMKE